ncbi:MAG: hypothetical protein IJD16_04600 [Desulfovibrio sp.]|nr:hypothetical protein [Desulfovibrio sp.]
MKKYVTVRYVAEILSCTPSAARKWLKRNNVHPLSLGVGRGLGLRWNLAEVEAVIAGAILVPKEKEEKKPRRLPLSQRPLEGRSLAEQLALINGGTVQ